MNLYSKKPLAKIPKIIAWLEKHAAEYDIDSAIELIEQKFGVFIFCYYGRLKEQQHTLEIWSRTNQYRNKQREMKEQLCTIEVPVEAFKLTTV